MLQQAVTGPAAYPFFAGSGLTSAEAHNDDDDQQPAMLGVDTGWLESAWGEGESRSRLWVIRSRPGPSDRRTLVLLRSFAAPSEQKQMETNEA